MNGIPLCSISILRSNPDSEKFQTEHTKKLYGKEIDLCRKCSHIWE